MYAVNEQLQPKNVKLSILRIDSIKMKNTCKTRIKRYAEMESPWKFFFQQWNTVILSPNITQELWLFIQLGFQQNVNDSLDRNYLTVVKTVFIQKADSDKSNLISINEFRHYIFEYVYYKQNLRYQFCIHIQWRECDIILFFLSFFFPKNYNFYQTYTILIYCLLTGLH